jgi:PST family polysaccharide transporter
VSTVVLDEPERTSEVPGSFRADTLAASVILLLVMTVAQRAIGFGRGVLFCRWLEPEQIGQWDVAFGFLNLAAPLVVLGLPGSFGRYAEYFRQRGQFHLFLRRTALVSVLATITGATVMLVFKKAFSRLIFGSEEASGMIVWLALALAALVAHYFLVALFIAVRQYRVVTALQFVQSLGFAVISLVLLAVWPAGATTVVVGFGLATLVAAITAGSRLRRLVAQEPEDWASERQTQFWAKLLPFATWMWLTNLLANLFEVIDRYMIVHHGGMSAAEALREVGIYHSSRLVPLLFVAVAGLLGSMVTPHLSQDWEAGRRDSVVRRLNLMLKMLIGSQFAAAIGVLFFAPLLFEVAFQNKYQGGLVVLPWTLAYCTWFGTIAVAQNYLWCAERASLGSLALVVGLVLNIGMNLLLLPRFGLQGAVWATTAANLVTLSLTYEFSRWYGMRVDRGTWLLTLAPLGLVFGPWTALGLLALLVVAAVGTNGLLTRGEKDQIRDSIGHGLRKLRRMHVGGTPEALITTH